MKAAKKYANERSLDEIRSAIVRVYRRQFPHRTTATAQAYADGRMDELLNIARWIGGEAKLHDNKAIRTCMEALANQLLKGLHAP